ncbi:hypothetical protein LOTGIDRAFT_119020, partial [Lottia gigantea]
RLTLVESIPLGLKYEKNATIHPSTVSALHDLVVNANTSIHIASYYWSMRGKDLSYHDDTSKPGENLFESLLQAGKNKVKIQIVQNLPSKVYPDNDTKILAKEANAEVRTLNMTKLIGKGILHTKLWIFDEKHFYVGSANLDWRSFTQVKELGIVVKDCSCLAKDMMKIFEVYWFLANEEKIPSSYASKYLTKINIGNPDFIRYNDNQTAHIYLSSSPPQLCPGLKTREERTTDENAILSVISEAKSYIYIAVMDYYPTTLYNVKNIYWPNIDDALRKAAFDRAIHVRLLASHWNHTRYEMFNYLRSLFSISKKNVSIEVKVFRVNYTADQAKIPFSRVNHNKYMVTDKHAYIGTSNWSGDYFINTCGVGFILKPNSTTKSGEDVRKQLEEVFLRDWYSPYAFNIYRNHSIKPYPHRDPLRYQEL